MVICARYMQGQRKPSQLLATNLAGYEKERTTGGLELRWRLHMSERSQKLQNLVIGTPPRGGTRGMDSKTFGSLLGPFRAVECLSPGTVDVAVLGSS